MIKEYKNHLFALALFIIVFMICVTYQKYFFNDVPPRWDSLAYQIMALKASKAILDGEVLELFSLYWKKDIPIFHIGTLSLGNLLFGLNSHSFYIISYIIGILFLYSSYNLAILLNSNKKIALTLIVIFGVTPNFIIQNFFNSRNDYLLALFLCWSWYYYIKAIDTNQIRYSLASGFLIGLGVLSKFSAPGYIIIFHIVNLILPEKFKYLGKRNLRFKHSIISGVSCLISCGWFYIPALSPIIKYYVGWGNMKEWTSAQYQLYTSDPFFYFKNISHLHFGSNLMNLIYFAMLFSFAYLIINFKKTILKYKQEQSEIDRGLQLLLVLILSSITTMLFLSYRGTYASIGDIPILGPLIASLTFFLTIIFKICFNLNNKKYFQYSLVAIIPPFMIFNLFTLPIQRVTRKSSFSLFNQEIDKLRVKYQMQGRPLIQVFSHPLYNADTYAWNSYFKDFETVQEISQSTSSRPGLGFLEHLKIDQIVERLEKFPLLIISSRNAAEIGGEHFHPFNIHQKELTNRIKSHNKFNCLKTVPLEDNIFPIQICMNKNYTVGKIDNISIDHWSQWEDSISLFFQKKSIVKISGTPLKDVRQIFLKSSNDSQKIILLKKLNILSNGRYEFISETINPLDKVENFILLTDEMHIKPASAHDQRKLAFLNLHIEVIEENISNQKESNNALLF